MSKLSAVLIVSFSCVLLLAQQNEGIAKFQNYRQQPNSQNLIELINYFAQTQEDKYLTAQILGNVYLMELENQLQVFEVNSDSLSYGNMFGYANLLLAMGRYEKSIEIYNKLNELSPKWSCPWRHKGEALLKSHQLEAAETATLKAIETREDHFDAYIQLARIQKEQGRYQEALQTLNNGLAHQEADTEEEVSHEEVMNLKRQLQELIR
jgi:tetratricopeptide (TPR) repeat protein